VEWSPSFERRPSEGNESRYVVAMSWLTISWSSWPAGPDQPRCVTTRTTCMCSSPW
jgi:hypothetical protein